MKWLTCLPDIFNKEVTWLKINKWAVNLFLCLTGLYLCLQTEEPKITLYENYVNRISS